jgi:hypothetical protein
VESIDLAVIEIKNLTDSGLLFKNGLFLKEGKSVTFSSSFDGDELLQYFDAGLIQVKVGKRVVNRDELVKLVTPMTIASNAIFTPAKIGRLLGVDNFEMFGMINVMSFIDKFNLQAQMYPVIKPFFFDVLASPSVIQSYKDIHITSKGLELFPDSYNQDCVLCWADRQHVTCLDDVALDSVAGELVCSSSGSRGLSLIYSPASRERWDNYAYLCLELDVNVSSLVELKINEYGSMKKWVPSGRQKVFFNTADVVLSAVDICELRICGEASLGVVKIGKMYGLRNVVYREQGAVVTNNIPSDLAIEGWFCKAVNFMDDSRIEVYCSENGGMSYSLIQQFEMMTWRQLENIESDRALQYKLILYRSSDGRGTPSITRFSAFNRG